MLILFTSVSLHKHVIIQDPTTSNNLIYAPFQLLDLGFEEEQIVDALLKHDNDRDKALEELIA